MYTPPDLDTLSNRTGRSGRSGFEADSSISDMSEWKKADPTVYTK